MTHAWPIDMGDVLRALHRIRPYLPPTPLRNYPLLDREVGFEVHLKLESTNPTGSFKDRNGLSALTALPPDARARGVIAATRGNHGQGLAYAGRELGIPVHVCIPEGNNPEKNASMEALGATLHIHGANYDEAVDHAKTLIEAHGYTLVHSTNDFNVIAGAATLTWELLQDAPDLDALVVCVGGGSQSVGALTVARALRPDLQVYGVQAARAPAIHDSWHAGEPLQRLPQDTLADGLATSHPYPATFATLRAGLKDFVLAPEDLLEDTIRLLLRTTHHVAEGAGAAGLAGARVLHERLAGRRVGVILSGGNLATADLKRLLQ